MSDGQVNIELELNGASKQQPAASASQQQGATVSFHNIHYKVKEGGSCLCRRKTSSKAILIDLNGIMKPGLNAIMGATGSGKSSFLDILAARKDPAGLTGEVLIDGAPQPPNFKCLSGYVVQDDVVMGTLTVRENLNFSAALRLPAHVPQKEKEQKVNKLIEELGLGRVADSRVGTQLIRGVSGGERKRTNIGMELIIDPSVLFLDEPTTGLDASTANSVLLLLKRMANNGRTIILSIHQPRYSIYRLFDSLTLLVNGKQVYHGPAQRALEYFSDIGYTCETHNNPADFFLDVINGDSTAVAHSKDGCDGTVASHLLQMIFTPPTSFGFFFLDAFKHKIMLKFFDKNTLNKKYLMYCILSNDSDLIHYIKHTHTSSIALPGHPEKRCKQVVVTIFLALVVGAIFFGVKEDQTGSQNRFGALFFITVNQCFSSLSSAELFITERKLFIHEYISGYYRLSVYFLSKILSDILMLRTIPAVIFSCVAYFMIGKLKKLKEKKKLLECQQINLFHLKVWRSEVLYLSIPCSENKDSSVHWGTQKSFLGAPEMQGHLKVNLLAKGVVLWSKIPRKGALVLQPHQFIYPASKPILKVFVFFIATLLCCTGEASLTSQGVDFSTWGFWQNHVALTIMTICFLTITYLKLRFIPKFS
uniref:ABC transporter domain-containing protein n=1 Tax=Tetraodon nigroviridis TaxID=99883 RepID=H3DQ46_TETNG